MALHPLPIQKRYSPKSDGEIRPLFYEQFSLALHPCNASVTLGVTLHPPYIIRGVTRPVTQEKRE